MKLVWLAPFPLQGVETELPARRAVGIGTGSWLINLSQELGKDPAVELHIITYSAAVASDAVVRMGPITLHVVRYSFPFVSRGFPDFFRWDLMSWYAAFVRKALRIINTINPDLIHAHGTEGPYSLVAYKSNRPNVTSIQGIIAEYIRVDAAPWLRQQAPIEQFCIQQNTHFGCRTDWDKGVIQQINSQAVLHYMPEAMNPVFFEHYWQDSLAPVLLFVGSVSPRKGIAVLIDALALVNQVIKPTLLVVGGGGAAYRKYLDDQIAVSDLGDQVTFLGSKNPGEIAVLLSQASVYVLPTFMDNSPNSLCEAMAVGTPSVASNVGGIPSLINDEETGLLVKTGQPRELANALIRLLTNPALRQTFSKRSRHIAFERNHPGNVARQTLRVYLDIIDQSSPTINMTS